ncbi:hypothetical protein T484DRAFT_1806587 [Baffinella frigidus]|nr:hypothetical protein T484DRAFT_1806587 [Cryptophyta sp. CCMP2293]
MSPPFDVVAAIVTCGGLCPGLNNVVAAITDCLHKSYGVGFVEAIVTCGGLCPGLNNVVAAITDCLHKSYGVKKVYGIQNGYKSFYTVKKVYGIQNGYKGFYTREWKEMTRESVRNVRAPTNV